jgi:uncharacterized protein YqeY
MQRLLGDQKKAMKAGEKLRLSVIRFLMGCLMPRVKGKADGSLVKKVVEELLG